jgi:DNA-binding transcriptional ArsR family regulator
MPPELVGKVVERFKALADQSRIRLLLCLRRGECNVNTLTRELGLAQASVSKHLGVLKRAGLVEARRKGTQALYRVHDASIYELCKHVCDGVLSHLQEEHAALRLGPIAGRGSGRGVARAARAAQGRKGRKS